VSKATPAAVAKTHCGRLRENHAVTSESVIGKTPKTRFPNSMKAWASSSGKNAPSSHPGQPSQPSPEPVSRTSDPVMTMT
jgi:hypothetical protein